MLSHTGVWRCVKNKRRSIAALERTESDLKLRVEVWVLVLQCLFDGSYLQSVMPDEICKFMLLPRSPHCEFGYRIAPGSEMTNTGDLRLHL